MSLKFKQYWINYAKSISSFWVDGRLCCLYTKSKFPSSELIPQIFELVYVPVEYDQAVTANTLDQMKQEDRDEIEDFIVEHTFRFRVRELLAAWHVDYVLGDIREDEYYVSDYANHLIKSVENCPCSAYSSLFKCFSTQLESYRQHIQNNNSKGEVQ